MPLASLRCRSAQFDDERLNQKAKIATLKIMVYVTLCRRRTCITEIPSNISFSCYWTGKKMGMRVYSVRDIFSAAGRGGYPRIWAMIQSCAQRFAPWDARNGHAHGKCTTINGQGLAPSNPCQRPHNSKVCNGESLYWLIPPLHPS